MLASDVEREAHNCAQGQHRPTPGRPYRAKGNRHACPEKSHYQNGEESLLVLPDRRQKALQEEQSSQIVGVAKVGRTVQRRTRRHEADRQNHADDNQF